MAFVFILVAVGRVGEIIPGLSRVPLVKISLGIAILALLSNWKALPKLHESLAPATANGRWLFVFVLISVPFSIWKGPSVMFLYQVLPVLVVAIVLIAKLSANWHALRVVLAALMLAGGALALTGLSAYVGGRIAVESMYDTNDLAYVLVTLFPLTCAAALSEERPWQRLLFSGLAGALVISILLTSSRGGLIGLVVATAIIVFNNGKLPLPPAGSGQKHRKKSRLAQIVLSLLACSVIGAFTWGFLPPDTQARLASVMSLGSDYNMDPDNDTGRSQIWKRGMEALKDRPWGYGVASFGMVDFRYGGRMLAPHSSLVQVSVELGLIAFLLYLRMYFLVWKGLAKSRQLLAGLTNLSRERGQQAIYCRMLQACLAGNFVAGVFLSMAYANVLWITFGVALALSSLIHRDLLEAAPERREN